MAEVLCHIHERRPITELGHGMAPGADTLADEWALLRGILVKRYPANWNKYGKSAGPIRNQYMLETFKPNGAVAFFGAHYTGTGTTDMVTRLREAGVPVWEIRN